MYKTTRPDIDNIQKACFDALNGLLFKDDSQIVSVTATKWHAAALIYGVVWAIILPEGDERLGHVYNCFLAAMVLGMCVRVLAAWNRP